MSFSPYGLLAGGIWVGAFELRAASSGSAVSDAGICSVDRPAFARLFFANLRRESRGRCGYGASGGYGSSGW